MRRFSSADKPAPVNEPSLNISLDWVTRPETLSAAAGMHRFVWDLRYPEPPTLPGSASGYYPMVGPVVLPGSYTVTLTVDGRRYSAPLTVRMDPRVKTPGPDLTRQFQAADQAYRSLQQIAQLFGDAAALETRLKQAGGHDAVVSGIRAARRGAGRRGASERHGRPGHEPARPVTGRSAGSSGRWKAVPRPPRRARRAP